MNSSRLQNEIAKQGLPADFIATVKQCYAPIVQDIAARAKLHQDAYIVGVQGCQGSGKSTLASFLKILLDDEGCSCSVLSIDDFYLTKRERQQLAETVHPLLATRGVPGTHDVALALEVIENLKSLNDGESFAIPRFDKSIDDRADPVSWDEVSGKQSIIILEGWCVGLEAQDAAELKTPRNRLEEQEDSKGIWRSYVNNTLGNDYQDLFQALQCLIVLTAPSFECVFRWRSLQEEKLIQKIAAQGPTSRAKTQTMNPEQILRFISHYQRLTEHALASLPSKADWLLELAGDHSIIACEKT